MLNGFTPFKVERKFDPFPYQIEADIGIQKAFNEFERVLVVVPTGGGKTFIAGEEIAKRLERKKRVLILAHTRKLVRQFAKATERDYGIWVTVEIADERSDDDSMVVCATIQSLKSRIAKKRWKKDEFDLVIVDEAHRILSDGYAKALEYFQCQVLGITATPRRGDQKDLMSFFETKAVDIPLARLIKEGFLSPLKIKNFPLRIQLTGASPKGDWTDEEVAHAIEPYLESCADEYKILGAGRCGLVFLPLIETSKKFTDLLLKVGVRAAHVDGTMTEKQVQDRINALTCGDLDVLCCSMLLTEGVDIRPVNIILNLRPTKSWVLYVQMNGRGTRLFKEKQRQEVIDEFGYCHWGIKEDCILLDPLWLCDDHSMLQRPACLVAGNEEEAAQIDDKLSKGGRGDDDPLDLLEAVESAAFDRHEALRQRLERLKDRKGRLVDAMELFSSMGMDSIADYEPVSRWEFDAPTPGQIALMRKANIDLEGIKDKGMASLVCAAIIKRRQDELATIPMAKLARSKGMEDAFVRKFEDVKQFLNTGEDPLSEIPN